MNRIMKHFYGFNRNALMTTLLLLSFTLHAATVDVDWNVIPNKAAQLYINGSIKESLIFILGYSDKIKAEMEYSTTNNEKSNVAEAWAKARFFLAYKFWRDVMSEKDKAQPNEETIKSLLFGPKKGEKRDGTGAYNHALNVFRKYPTSDVAVASGRLCIIMQEFITTRYNKTLKVGVSKQEIDSIVDKTRKAEEPNDAMVRMANGNTNLEEFKSARLSLLKQRITPLLNKAQNDHDLFQIGGFYLGMPIDDAKKLVEYYLPDAPIIITKDNNIAIDKPETLFDSTWYWMYFCQADKTGKVFRFNFDRRFLKKWFRYDVQTHKEWVSKFGRDYKCDFRYNKVEKSRDMGTILPLTVKQDSYVYLNNLKDYKITYFGKKEVFDPTNGQAADAGDVGFAAGARGFSGGIPDNSQINAEAMRLTGQRIGVHSWIQHGYENGDGAKEGTLRVEVLKD